MCGRAAFTDEPCARFPPAQRVADLERAFDTVQTLAVQQRRLHRVALPAPEARIRSIEFGFRGPSTLHDGELVRFENEGFLVHMDLAAPVKSLKAAKEAVKDLQTGKEKALRKLIAGPPAGFAGPLSHEAFQQETITAKPGIYVEVCFMGTQDGRPHTRLGMERIIKIRRLTCAQIGQAPVEESSWCARRRASRSSCRRRSIHR